MLNSKSPHEMLYFHGKITRDQAEDLLLSQGAIEGMFLLRESVNRNFVLSLCHNNRINHYNIEPQADNTYQILTGRKFTGPVELVEHHMVHMDGFVTLAKIPLERYPSGSSYYILQGLKSSFLEESLAAKAIEMGLKNKSTIHDALKGPIRKHLQYLVLRDLHVHQPWFHHFIRRAEADKRLQEAGYINGQFLLREAKDGLGFALSLTYHGKPIHYKINEMLDKLQIDGGQYFDTLMELIDHYHFRQDGLLCKLRFAVECPGYVRSKIDMAQSCLGVTFEGRHTSLCEVWSRENANTLSLRRPFSTKHSIMNSNDQNQDTLYRNPTSELANNSPDLISFNEWSTNLSKILNIQTSASMMNFTKDSSLPKSTDHVNKSGNVFHLIKNNIASPQTLFTSVKEIFHLTKSCNSNSIMKIDNEIDEPQTDNNGFNQSDITHPVEVQHPIKVEEISKPKSSKSLGKLEPSDLSLLDPLFDRRSGSIFDGRTSGGPSFDLSIEKLEIKHKLGGGNFGYVYSGFYTTDESVSIPVAVKMLKKEVHSFVGSQEILSEAATMVKLIHKHVVRLIGVCKSDRILLVLELAPLGPINKYLRLKTTTPIWTIVGLMNQVANGMAYLEALKFVHRDLAARNVLLVSTNYAKISDFGMSKALNYGHEYYRAATAGKWPLKWYAPECLYYFRFDNKSDVWSYGITLWEVFSYGEKPYKNLKGTEILGMLEKGQRLKIPEKCPAYIYDLMLQCWTMDASLRPSFAELDLTMAGFYSRCCRNIQNVQIQSSYQATSSGSSVAKTSYESGELSHFPVPPDYGTEIETWSKESDTNSDLVTW